MEAQIFVIPTIQKPKKNTYALIVYDRRTINDPIFARYVRNWQNYHLDHFENASVRVRVRVNPPTATRS